MKSSSLSRNALSICMGAVLLSGCGALRQAQDDVPPIGAPGVTQQSVRATAPESSPYQLVYSFAGGSDGSGPYAGLINEHGTLYGTTVGGGADGYGTVFSVTMTGEEKVLHPFSGSPADGAAPYGGLIDVNGTLYGTTFYGGAHGYGTYYPAGTVFSVTTTGNEKLLHSFGYGYVYEYGPYADLIDVKGTLYGTTYDGGVYYGGTIFSVTTAGREKVVHGFGYGTDGSQPIAGLLNVKGVLYGTTPTGGANEIGTVFSLTTAGAERVTHSFSGGPPDGENPNAALINVKGILYGTASTGGRHNAGTVFRITTSGKETTLYSFCSKRKCVDGSNPEASLIDVNGTLYGTTFYGGKYSCSGSHLCGTVFSLTMSGKETALHSFGGSGDGVNPNAGLIDLNGTLYGTTTSGGAYGAGTVFAFTP